jgi:hypothetical protein
MKNHFSLILVIITIFCKNLLYAQGCSDAGGCSIQSMHSAKKSDSTYKNALSIGYGVGMGIQKTLIHTTMLEWQHTFNDKISFQAKLPLLITQGDLGTYTGLGDILISLSYRKKIDNQFSYTFSIGSKLATSNSNLKNSDGLSLPMVYQTSLGTYDLIYSLGLNYNSWLLGIGFQQVVSHNNKNNYNDSLWTPESLGSSFPQSNQLKRGNDLIIRFEKSFEIKRFSPNLGLLYLYRFKGDGYLSRTSNEYLIDPGTKGSTLNIYLGSKYSFSKKSTLEFIYAQPVVNRTVSADGLLRKFVFNLKYTYQF